MDTNRHPIAMNVLIDSVLTALAERTDFFVGGNMFVYYSRSQAMNRDFRGPDFFVALDVDGSRERQGWVIWEEEGRYPDVIVELMSPSTAKILSCLSWGKSADPPLVSSLASSLRELR